MASSPTTRTLERLRKEGYSAAVVEKWNAFAGPRKKKRCDCGIGWVNKPVGIRQDLFGCMDVLAVKHDVPGVLAVQACAYSGISARFGKALLKFELRVWLAAGNRFEVWGWKKNKQGRYEVRVVVIDRIPQDIINDQPSLEF